MIPRNYWFRLCILQAKMFLWMHDFSLTVINTTCVKVLQISSLNEYLKHKLTTAKLLYIQITFVKYKNNFRLIKETESRWLNPIFEFMIITLNNESLYFRRKYIIKEDLIVIQFCQTPYLQLAKSLVTYGRGSTYVVRINSVSLSSVEQKFSRKPARKRPALSVLC